ncbi:diacylglycerol kinase family lipid kinase [Candidatus Acetothermia bacterium]|nr:diacylglycerol kinase family lipid kinase [Candidatus Acetothermia bacterium]MBI3460885.1 diacylglycerol kinase family lipid kinase [Candidatus Acetothermia bacterium]
MGEKFFIILNPACGRGQGRKLLTQLQQELAKQKLEYELYRTERPIDATKAATEAGKRFSVVVAAGGDGTVNEVVNGLVGTGVAFGVIPIGSGNDFAKCLNVPPDVRAAVQILKNAKRRCVDIAKLGDRYFTNGLGIGLDGAISHRNRAIKYLHGKAAYMWAAVSEACSYRASSIQMKTPSWEYSGRFLLAGASNGHCHGGDFLLAPHAKIDDGLLDIHLVTDMKPLRRLMQIPKVKQGQHLTLPEVQMHQAPWLELTTEVPLLAHLDGEPFLMQPGQVRVHVVSEIFEVISG